MYRAAPGRPDTQGLLPSLPRTGLPLRTRLPVLAGAPPAPGAGGAGCGFAPRCPGTDDLCRREEPALRAVDGRAVACHHPSGEAA
ncbi:oligopeptide/dipeptide ABC transporter ATP-binding protein [Streptomyces roseolus]|uniref:oligopeptide/dipeptide ABC transporter ATP-binding protein n=1 Tax=Streptomyces roseolus TaxID=67358 RepID=UPI0033E8E0DF